MSVAPEVIGLIAAVEGLIKGSITLYRYAHDVVKYHDELKEFIEQLHGPGGLETQLRLLSKYAEKADAADGAERFLFEGLFSLKAVTTPERQEKEKEVLSENYGSLSHMQSSMDRMEKKLNNPDTSSFGKTFRPLKWIKTKSDVKGLIDEVHQWRQQVEFALNYDRLTLEKANYDLTKGIDQQTAQILVQGKSIEEEIRELKLDSKEQKARKERRDREREDEKRKQLTQQIADWLSPLDFSLKHGELLEVENPIDMTEELRKTSEYEAWKEGKPWVLSCWADAGAGKTILTSMMIEHLKSSLQDDNVPVLYMYLNYKDQKMQTATNLYGNLIKQLITYDDTKGPSDELIETYKKKVKKSNMTAREKKDALCREVNRYNRVFIVVDALDESSQTIKDLYYTLLGKIDFKRLSLMVTSRDPEPGREKGMKCDCCGEIVNYYYECYECPNNFYLCYPDKKKGKTCHNPDHVMDDAPENPVFLNVAPSEAAIEGYVKKEIGKEANAGHTVSARNELKIKRVGVSALGLLRQDDPGLEARVIESICIMANDKFLLAKLYVESLKTIKTRAGIERALNHLPEGYADTYEQTMIRIQQRRGGDFELTVAIISWVVWALRPLTVDELLHALATNVSSGFDPEELSYEDLILEATSGLVRVSDNTVYLAHYTAYEYFMAEGGKWFGFHVPSNLALICLSYMATEDLRQPLDIRSPQDDYDARIKQYPFASYAYEYWGNHAREAIQMKPVFTRILDFLNDEQDVAAFVQAFWYLQSAAATRWEIRKGASALHIAAWFGLTDVIPDLIQKGLDVNYKDPASKQTPLMIATRQGHVETLEFLLEHRALINEVSTDGMTAMLEAFTGKHLDAVEALLKRKELDINYHFIWRRRRTILMGAAAIKDVQYTDVILLHKSLEVEINAMDEDGVSALGLACASGQKQVVYSLLKHPLIDVNIRDRLGRTPLSLTAISLKPTESPEIAELLLGNGADAEARDYEGGLTAIIRAAEEGNFELIEALYSHDNQLLKQTDDDGRSLLHAAANTDRVAIVRFVISNGVDVNIRDSQGRTPLHAAARSGCRETIELLLELGAVSQNDVSGRKPWLVAWQNGHLAAAHLLNIEIAATEGPENPNSPHLDLSDLPLWSLVMHDCEDLITKLAHDSPSSFQTAAADPDTGDTALHLAMEDKHSHILPLLLRTSISLTQPNLIGRTPLHAAARAINKDLITSLLAYLPHDSTHLNPRDRNQQTPLDLANDERNVHSASLLVGAGAIIEHKSMILPIFFRAIEYGYIDAVRVLIAEYGAPVNAKNSKGESAMAVAKMNGWRNIERELERARSLYVGVGRTAVEAGEGEGEDEDDDEEEVEAELERNAMREEGNESWKVSFPRPLGLEDEVNEGERDGVALTGAGERERKREGVLVHA